MLTLSRENGSGLVAGACIGILVASIVVFIVVRYLILLRKWLTEKKLEMRVKGANRGAQHYSAHEMKNVRPTGSSSMEA